MNGKSRQDIDVARLRSHHLLMHRIRALEEVTLKAQDDKLVFGAIHPSIGQEAVAVGVIAQLTRRDLLLSTHRGHGHTLAKGASSTAMFHELLGREGGACAGKGGSMHIADFSVGMLGANGVVAANIVIAAGAAHAIKLKKEDRIVACFFGDGATNRGPFLEGLNWAAVFDLPVLFVCEDNGYAATTRTRAMTAGPGLSERARALGLPTVEVDGNDVTAVEIAAAELIREVRGGKGARFLHARTFRMTGHTGGDPAVYRPKGEVEAAKAHDPIARTRALLIGAGVAVDMLDADEASAYAEMEGAYRSAREASFPAVAEALTDVQDVGSPLVEAF
ncbi:thiamine pyrophosphate-dependent dehydrogenase E1 component subunit alpha [Bradyrhizobium sp. 87]|uniref:thiamine pyrophosphate-dependent dehydrogenase E1 component subunit alpha n=1 Tax=Bradyrhizobium sp. 87 TaxID=2782682 RepID=UPI001FFABECF|nr:thiamine pyrophosphate-dependent dehydrogenase E1 component subunit alpha [Bradyrhizobium sp. 87]MCK1429171.1 thiamine pyrophosphate-dependent dehydrogenase E1 component subunit alpha [Bradyrhizobium sp. 87]